MGAKSLFDQCNRCPRVMHFWPITIQRMTTVPFFYFSFTMLLVMIVVTFTILCCQSSIGARQLYFVFMFFRVRVLRSTKKQSTYKMHRSELKIRTMCVCVCPCVVTEYLENVAKTNNKKWNETKKKTNETKSTHIIYILYIFFSFLSSFLCYYVLLLFFMNICFSSLVVADAAFRFSLCLCWVRSVCCVFLVWVYVPESALFDAHTFSSFTFSVLIASPRHRLPFSLHQNII